MKGRFQISSVNLDSGLIKQAFSQGRLATSIESDMNVVTHCLAKLHFLRSILHAFCSGQKCLAV